MSNYCSNYMMIKGDKETLAEMYAYLQSGEDGEFDFALIVPPPKGNQTENTWYIENWGTNRKPEDVDMAMKNESLTVHYGTAWAPSLPVSLELSKKFPEVFIQHTYSEGDMGLFGFGVFHKGQLMLSEDDIDEDKDQIIEKVIEFIDSSLWILDDFHLDELMGRVNGEDQLENPLSILPGTEAIKPKAFMDRKDLTSIVIPIGVTKIGNQAFKGCSSLTSIVLPESLKTIGESAFEDCSALTFIVLPVSIRTLGEMAFGGCTNLTSLQIPAGVKKISNNLCDYCTNLATVGIPKGVKEIGEFAFNECYSLTSVEIPHGVNLIGENAFYRCYKLASVVIQENVIEIADSAFSECTALESLLIPQGVEYIGVAAFGECTGLSSVVISDGVKELGRGAFSGCSNLSYVEIRNSEIRIYWNSFAGCPKVVIHAPKGSSAIEYAKAQKIQFIEE